MAAAVITVAEPTDERVQKTVQGNLKVRFVDVTSNTGDYAAGGFDIDATDVGLRHISFVSTSGGVATQGTAGASAVGVGITYADDGSSVTVQLYEVDTAADGSPLQEKGAEAMAANFTIRLKIEGF